MRLTVLGGAGVWPPAGGACSGYLVEHDGFRLLVDPGYAILPRLLERLPAGDIDAVFVSHGHPDHCADLSPLLRARTLHDDPAPPLDVYAPPGALRAILALDRPGLLDPAVVVHDVSPGASLSIGPFEVRTAPLPHWLPNAGVRLAAGQTAIAYTGDAGPSDGLVDLARDADLLLAEATFVEEVPTDSLGGLSSARDAGEAAARAGVGRLVLTHLQPGTDPGRSASAARTAFDGPTDVALPGLVVDLD